AVRAHPTVGNEAGMCPGINGLTKCAPIADWVRRGVPLWCSRVGSGGSRGWARNGRAVKALPYGAAGETRKTKILKTNLECPLESMRSKNGWGRRRQPEFRCSKPGLKPFIANRLRCERPLRRGCIELYHIAMTILTSSNFGIWGILFTGKGHHVPCNQ